MTAEWDTLVFSQDRKCKKKSEMMQFIQLITADIVLSLIFI